MGLYGVREKRSVVRLTCIVFTVILFTALMLPAKLDVMQSVLGLSTLPPASPGKKPVTLDNILMSASGE